LLAEIKMETSASPAYEYDPDHNVYFEDCVEGMKKRVDDGSVNAVVTSPPYNKNLTTQETGRDLYEDDMPEEDYRKLLNNVFSEAFRVLSDDGHLFVNLKNRIDDGVLDPPFWFHDLQAIQSFTLRSYAIWNITGNFDSSGDRFPNDYEVVFHYTKSPESGSYTWEQPSPDKNTSVWDIGHVMGNDSGRSDHPAQYPAELVERCILPATEMGDTILDPFMGSGTTAVAAIQNNRDYVGFELDEEGAYKPIIERRIGEAKRQRDAGVNEVEADD